VDHRIRGDFVLSPLPALAWKNDWLRNPKRQQSIAAYPILEQPMDSYLWKNAHFAFKSEGLGDKKVPGVDYLLLYWLGVDGGIIGSGE
jgi:hypothetical protein